MQVVPYAVMMRWRAPVPVCAVRHVSRRWGLRVRRLICALSCLSVVVGGLVPLLAGAPAASAAPRAISAAPAQGGTFHPVNSTRVLDTRTAGGVTAAGTLRFAVGGRGAIPADAAAVAVNVTVLTPARSGSVSVYPGDSAWNGSASISFVPGQTKQSMITAKLGGDGSLVIRNNTAAVIQVIGDVVGYYAGGTASAAGALAPIPQQRVFDTRAVGSAPLPSGGTARIPITGRGAIPASGVGAVLVNVTVISPGRAGGLQTYPSGGYDVTPSVSFAAGRSEQDELAIGLGGDGAVVVRNTAPVAVQVVLDAIGYLLSGIPAVQGSYQPVTPVRVYDSRARNAQGAPIPAGQAVTLLAGESGIWDGRSPVPGSGVPAELVRFSVLTPTRAGSISVYPTAAGWNGAASISFGAGATTQQQFTVVPDASSRWQLRNNTAVPIQVVIDVLGYYLGVPNPFYVGAGQLIDPPRGTAQAASCGSASLCSVVHANGYAEIWDGSSWTKPTKVAQAAFLESVSCAASGFCLAGGGEQAGETEQIYRYSDGTWSVASTLSMPDRDGFGIVVVSCASGTFCLASNGGSYRTFNGTTWSAEKQIAGAPYFAALSCTSAAFCMAADSSGVIYRYNGTGWTKQAAAMSPQATDYMALSCASASLCALTDGLKAVIYQGTGWSALSTPSLRFITSVSCAGSVCWATDPFGHAASYDGTAWSNASGTGVENSAIISCVSATSCLLVGTGQVTRAAFFDGTHWGPVAMLDVLPGNLAAVSCVSASFCIAVDLGGYVFRYDGASWSAPEEIDPGQRLEDVSCTSSSFCAAVDDGGSAMTFDGTSWSSPVLLTGSFNNRVSCAAATMCVAGDQYGYLFRYDGSSWAARTRVFTAPVTGISCPTTNFCAAVDNAGHAATFDGTSWTTPTATSVAMSNGVTCTASSFCLATGAGTLATWDGTSWSALAAPITGELRASCPAAEQCVVTGDDPAGRAAMLMWDQGRWSMSMDTPYANGRPLPMSCPTATFCMMLDNLHSAYALTS